MRRFFSRIWGFFMGSAPDPDAPPQSQTEARAEGESKWIRTDGSG